MKDNNLFNKESSIYMGAQTIQEKCNIGIFGVEFDGTTSYKPGARFGPNAIRNASQCLETYCPELKKDLKDIKYYDAGSLILDFKNTESTLKNIYNGTKYILNKNLKPLIFGGEHSLTIGAVQALAERFPNLALIQLDAHADLRNSYQNNKYSHACTMRRCLELLEKNKIFQVGIRSGTKTEFDFMTENNQLINFKSCNKNNDIGNIFQILKNTPVYLTIDLDWFDPSLISGTGTPEPGGYFWQDFEHIIKALFEINIVGADIVELSPDLDISGVSSIVAAKIARSLIMTLDKTS
tara:strand:+ start:2609 stop:3493 length:885 start_codon:yes stop_codon:yes gene_type:complete